MKKHLKQVQYKIFKEYEKYGNTFNVKDVTWDYTKPNNISQIEHNEGLKRIIYNAIDEYGFNVIITSSPICVILDNFDEFYPIGEDDVHNYVRYKSEVCDDFEPYYLIKEDNKNIGLVIKTDIRLESNTVILTNSQVLDYMVVKINNLPLISLLDYFK